MRMSLGDTRPVVNPGAQHMRCKAVGIALGLAALPACDESSGPTSALCATQLDVSVTEASSSVLPLISWAPACQVQQIVVLEPMAPSVGGPQVRWAVDKVTGGGMAPPLRYGQTLPGARVLMAAEPLVAGHHYVVQLSMAAVVGTSTMVGEGGFTR
jgi:hypothetical protein